MDIPRGHAMLPLNEGDFLDFIYNYFKAEYAPIRSFWSTATADPRQPQRWVNMGHEMQPLSVRPANAQAQKDLESLDYFTRKWHLDLNFVRGLVIRFAKYELHDRLEKKLFECARLDLMIRKALKEKHLIDALWPSPAPRSEPRDLLAQGVQVRRWYGDMFAKYFLVLHSVDEFEIRPEVDQRIKSSGTLMLVPFVDHLVIGTVDPITPIVARGAGYASDRQTSSIRLAKSDGYGEPGRFDVRFDAPAELSETYTKSVTRQCRCMKCGTKRDVQITISVDPSPEGGAATTRKPSITANSAVQRRLREGDRQERRHEESAPRQPPLPYAQEPMPEQGVSTPEERKQCPRCTFLNHASLTECEMCSADLPTTTVTNPPSPVASRVSHSHSVSLPPPATAPDRLKAVERPGPSNRHSLSSSLFSIFPFSQQHQQEHHANMPSTKQTDMTSVAATNCVGPESPKTQRATPKKQTQEAERRKESEQNTRSSPASSKGADKIYGELSGMAAEAAQPAGSVTPPKRPGSPKPYQLEEPELSQPPEMAMMPLTPPPSTSQQRRQVPAGLPSHLMGDYVPPSPSLPVQDDEDDAGWADLRRKESNIDRDGNDSDSEEGNLVDLDAVAREEAGVWGEREE